MAYASVDPPKPARLDLELVRGCDHTLTFVLTDKAERPIDITLDTVAFSARATWGGTAKISAKSNGVGDHSEPTNGETQFVIAAVDIDDEAETVGDTVWLYEVRRIQAGTLSETVHIWGELRIKPAVTRAT